MLDDYQLDYDGRIEKIRDTDEEFDRLFSPEGTDHIKVYDRDVLPALSKEQWKGTDPETGALYSGTHASSSNFEEMWDYMIFWFNIRVSNLGFDSIQIFGM